MSDQNHAAGAPAANVTPSGAPRSRVAWLLGIGLLMLLVIGGVVYWQRQAATGAAPAAQTMPPPEVTVATPVYQEITEWDEYTGQFSAVDKVELRRAGQRLHRVRSISRTGKSSMPATCCSASIAARMRSTLKPRKARYDEAAAQLDVATRQLERTSKLRKNDFAAATEFDERTSEAAGAKAALAGAQAAVEAAELNLEYTQVKAPISGRIGKHEVGEGNLITGGNSGNTTLLTTIVSLDPIYLEFDMSEAQFLAYQRAYEAGLMQSTRAVSVPVAGHLFDERNWTLKGNMNFVDNQVDRSAGTVRARVVFANPDAFITPGQFGRIRIPGSEPYKAILIPDSAIVTDQSQQDRADRQRRTERWSRRSSGRDRCSMSSVCASCARGWSRPTGSSSTGCCAPGPGAQVTPVDGKIEPVVAAN